MSSIIILKFTVARENYWGNEAHDDGVGLLTLASIAQAAVDVAAAGGCIYLYKAKYFGPMSLASEIVHVKGAGYRLRLQGDLKQPATGFLGTEAVRVQNKLARAEGVLLSGQTVRAFHFDDPQPVTLKVAAPFVVYEGEVPAKPEAIVPPVRGLGVTVRRRGEDG